MSFQEVYKNQVALLLEVLPILNEFDCFALKGGTAINDVVKQICTTQLSKLSLNWGVQIN